MKMMNHAKHASSAIELKLTAGHLGLDSEILSIAITASIKPLPPAYKPNYKGFVEARLAEVARLMIDSGASVGVARL
jgi:hypothetical protein